jgi:hypothetical protein
LVRFPVPFSMRKHTPYCAKGFKYVHAGAFFAGVLSLFGFIFGP